MNAFRTFNVRPPRARLRFYAYPTVLLAALGLLAAPAAPARAGCMTVNGTLTISGTVTTSCVNVTSNGSIVIRAGGKLVLTGSSGQYSVVDGSIILEGSGAELAFTTWPHTVSGSGYIEGQHDSAKITIAAGLTLTSTLNSNGITGALQITDATANGSFVNQGIVNANYNSGGNETLLIDVGGDLNDSSGDRWHATTSAGAILRFASTIGTIDTGGDGELEGNFLISGTLTTEIEINHVMVTNGRLQMSDGLLDVNENFTMGDDTTYYMDMQGGKIEVAAGKTFTHH